MLQIKGSQELIKKLNRDKLRIQHSVAETHRRIVKHIFTDLVTLTPQWSGNLASNWYIEFTSVKGAYKQLDGYLPSGEWDMAMATGSMELPFSRGMDPAVDTTLTRELSKLPKIRYNTNVRIVNYTPYAEDVEENLGPVDEFGIRRDIREVNQLASYGGVAMKGYIEMKYSNLNTLKRLAV
jgi:hypothetical protein